MNTTKAYTIRPYQDDQTSYFLCSVQWDGIWCRQDAAPVGNTDELFQNETRRMENASAAFLLSENYIVTLKRVTSIGYAISLLAMVIAFSIMLSIRRLHCVRNILHMNLFGTYILRDSFFFMLEYLNVPSHLDNTSSVQTPAIDRFCKFNTALWTYLTIANYSWMFVEGLHLRYLIFRTFQAHANSSIKRYLVIGWGLPLIVVGSWTCAKLLLDDTSCWTPKLTDKLLLLIVVPIFTLTLLNLCFFIEISTILYKKQQENSTTLRYKRWFRSMLILTQLFGIQYTVLLPGIYFCGMSRMVAEIWLCSNILLKAFQSFFVALFFCFLNQEVRTELRPYFSYISALVADCRYVNPTGNEILLVVLYVQKEDQNGN